MEYEGNVDGLLQCEWQGGSLDLAEPRDDVRPSTFHGHSDRAARDLPHSTCERGKF